MSIEEINKEINIETLKKENLSLKDKIEALRQENNSFLYSALSKFQGEMPVVQKNKINSFTKSKYADLAEMIKTIAPILTKHGLSFIQIYNMHEGKAYLKTILAHNSGQTIESNMKLVMPERLEGKKGNILHELGAATTYLKRYSLSAMLGVVADDDTDGN